MSIFSNPGKCFANILKKLGLSADVITKDEAEMLDAVGALLHTALRSGGTILWGIVKVAVANASALSGTTSDKRTAALKEIESQLSAKGIPFVENIARGLLEAAVAEVKVVWEQVHEAAPATAPVESAPADSAPVANDNSGEATA